MPELKSRRIEKKLTQQEVAKRIGVSLRSYITDENGAMYGLRNRIVHDYGNVDLGIVFNTLEK